MSSPITTHILDTSVGKPAAGVPVRLDRLEDGDFRTLGSGETDNDGRHRGLMAPPLQPGTYRMYFDTGAYFAAQGIDGFYPYAEVVFVITDTQAHYHVPLLLNPFGYATYRGS